MNYKEVQKIAKDTIEFARRNIHSGMKLLEIRLTIKESQV